MRINIRTHHYEITDVLHEYIEKKLTGLEKYLEGIKDAYVELTMDGHHKKGSVAQADITLHLLGDSDALLRATVAADDFHEAVDMSIAKLKAQIEDYKSKRRAMDKDVIREMKEEEE